MARVPPPGQQHTKPQQAPSLVDEALKYKGRVPYVYGGASPRGWDCSGFINYLLGHDLKLTLPGGIKGFSGDTHGPVVVSYATWSGATRVKGAPSPGDLAIWAGLGPLGHIGIVTGPNRMISALDPAYGTAETAIQGFGPPGAPLSYRRVKGVAAGGTVTAGAAAATGSGSALGDVAAAVGLGVLGVVLLAGALALTGAILTGALAGLAGAVVSQPGQGSTRAA
jgi:cell wall-associated NlpC family hydrolase